MKKYKSICLALVLFLVVFVAIPVSAKVPSHAAAAGSYDITIGDVVAANNNLSLDGVASATNYFSAFSQYGIVINWGDGAQTVYPSLSSIGFNDTGTDFNGYWSATHTYTYPGAYMISANLYRNNPQSNPAASSFTSVWVNCFYLPEPNSPCI